MDPETVLNAIATEYPVTKIAVCVCGPEPVVFATWDAVNRHGNRFDLHHETFNF